MSCPNNAKKCDGVMQKSGEPETVAAWAGNGQGEGHCPKCGGFLTGGGGCNNPQCGGGMLRYTTGQKEGIKYAVFSNVAAGTAYFGPLSDEPISHYQINSIHKDEREAREAARAYNKKAAQEADELYASEWDRFHK